MKGKRILRKTWENNIKQFLLHKGRIVRNLLNTKQTLSSVSYRGENNQDKHRKNIQTSTQDILQVRINLNSISLEFILLPRLPNLRIIQIKLPKIK